MDHDIQARLAFVGCDAELCAALREASPIVEAALPGILDSFYVHMRTFPEPAKLFSGSAQMEHAKQMQIQHWGRIVSGEFSDDYVRSVIRIGEAHYRLGLKPRWYIGGYALIVRGLVEAIETSMPSPKFGADKLVGKRAKMLGAVTTAALLDMDIAMSVYLEMGERAKNEVVDWLSKSVGEIIEMVGSASAELEATADTLTDTAKLTQQLTSAVTSSSDAASAGVQSVATATEELSASVDEISRQVQESAQIAGAAVDQAQKTDGRIAELNAAADRIGDVVKLITAIADQTKLLALNATIEAERAGETGKGFAVVAQEVKALAAQTATATEEIGTQIAAIQAATADSVNAIKQISHIIDQIAGISGSISSAVAEQGAATGEIANSAQQAASGTQEVVSSISEVNRGAMDTGAASGQVLAAAKTLSTESARLKSEVQSFLDRLRAA